MQIRTTMWSHSLRCCNFRAWLPPSLLAQKFACMKYILSAEDMLNSLRALPHSYRHTVETALIKIKMSCMWPKDEFVIPGLTCHFPVKLFLLKLCMWIFSSGSRRLQLRSVSLDFCLPGCPVDRWCQSGTKICFLCHVLAAYVWRF